MKGIDVRILGKDGDPKAKPFGSSLETGYIKPFLKVFRNDAPAPPPFWLMRQAGRYLPEYLEIRRTAKDFLDFCYTPEKAEEATLQPLRRYGFSAAILFSDILVVPDALSQKVAFHEAPGIKFWNPSGPWPGWKRCRRIIFISIWNRFIGPLNDYRNPFPWKRL